MSVLQLTLGLELELSNTYRLASLPPGSVWNKRDWSIVNDVNGWGVANDPLGKLWVWGGEVNTQPTRSAQSQAEVAMECIKYANRTAKGPLINYRSNLHIHIGGIPLDNIYLLKKILTYTSRYGKEACNLVDPIPKPIREEFTSEAAYKGAMKRYRRRLVSHHHQLPVARVREALKTDSFEDFMDAHAPLDRHGARAWGVATRPAINLMQLRDTQTIEFRHFPGSTNYEEILSALRWCKLYILAAINSEPIEEVWKQCKNWQFPKFEPYQHKLEQGWLATNFHTNTRKQVAQELSIWRKKGRLHGW